MRSKKVNKANTEKSPFWKVTRVNLWEKSSVIISVLARIRPLMNLAEKKLMNTVFNAQLKIH